MMRSAGVGQRRWPGAATTVRGHPRPRRVRRGRDRAARRRDARRDASALGEPTAGRRPSCYDSPRGSIVYEMRGEFDPHREPARRPGRHGRVRDRRPIEDELARAAQPLAALERLLAEYRNAAGPQASLPRLERHPAEIQSQEVLAAEERLGIRLPPDLPRATRRLRTPHLRGAERRRRRGAARCTLPSRRAPPRRRVAPQGSPLAPRRRGHAGGPGRPRGNGA